MEAEKDTVVLDFTDEMQQPLSPRRKGKQEKAQRDLQAALDAVLANTSEGVWPKLIDLGLTPADALVFVNPAGEFWISISELIDSNIVREIEEAYPTAEVTHEKRPTGDNWKPISPKAVLPPI